jgi:Tfx family DNA-binding protein
LAGTNCGLLTKQQIEILTSRQKGATLEAIAARQHTTRQNVSQIEKRARRNVFLARRTLYVYERAVSLGTITIPVGTRKVDIPSMVLTEGDRRKVHVRANFLTLFENIASRAPECVSDTHVVAALEIFILPEGHVAIYGKDDGPGAPRVNPKKPSGKSGR